MTWFLSDSAPDAPQPLDGQIPTAGQQFRGSVRDLWLRQNTWNQDQRYRDDLLDEMARSLGGLEHYMPRTRDETIEYKDPVRRGQYLARRIGELRQSDPQGTLAHLPGSPEEFDAEWQARRKKDFEENRAMLDRGDSAASRIAGEMVGTVLDPVNIALAPVGGGMANAGRFILAETALGAVAEIPGTIAEHARAPELGYTPEDPLVRIATGAAAGGAIGGIMVGGARAIAYGRSRMDGEAAIRPDGRPGAAYEDDVNAAEADLRSGREPKSPASYRPDISLPAEQDPAVINLTRLIGSLEAPKGFDQVYGGTVLRPPRSITTMTINEVLDWQRRSVAAGSKSSAAGRFQVIQDTLLASRDAMGLTGNELFDEAMQTRIGIHLMKGRGLEDWRAGRINTDRFMDNMAQEWAALPRATGPNAGRSHYDGDGLNQSLIGLDEARAIFGGQHVDAATPSRAAPATGGVDWPRTRAVTQFEQVSTPAGMSVDVRYRVVDLSDLRPASGDLQPRDRSRAASDEQIVGIARNLDPNRLLPAPESTSGSPVVGPDMIVESGNGRIAALNRAADEHPDRYQSYVRAIEDAGYSVPDDVKRPVLVAERVTDLDIDGRRRFVRESNTSSIARMSATEQAGVDADYLSQAAFDGYRPGRGLNSPDNAEFVRRVFAVMPQAERAGLMTTDGRLNIDGLRRLRQAMFARAFDAQDLLKLLAETEHPAVENMLRMLEDLAPDWAAFRAAVDAGYIRADFDITDPLMDAVRLIARARIEPRDGQTVIAALRDKLVQGDMFAARDPELTEAIVGAFYRGDRARGVEATQDILTRYMAEAEIAGRADIDDMFAAEAGVTPTAVLREAAAAQDARAPMPVRDDTVEPLASAAAGQPDIRSLDAMDTSDGAQSVALTRATDAALRDLRDAPEMGPFGPVLRQFEGKPEEAIDELRRLQTGDAVGALHHPATGPIDLVWGDAGKGASGHGLAKIIRKHPEVLDDLQGRLGASAEVLSETANRVRVTNGRDIFVISKDYQGDRKTWLLTGYEKKGNAQQAASRSMGRASELPEGSAPELPEGSSSPAELLPPQDSRATADFQDHGPTPEEAELADAMAQARAALDADPGLTLRMGEGPDAREIPLADLLDDLDHDEALMRSMTSCNLKGTPK